MKDKIVVFGSRHCPHCEPARQYLLEKGVSFEYIDISESIPNLKSFLKYRDTHPAFEEIKQDEKVGVPCFVINDGEKILFDYTVVEK